MSKKTRGIVATTAIITIMTLCFKLLGFVKQAVVAYYFGTTDATDIYYVAFNFVGSLSSAFIRAITISLVSIYTHALVQKGREAASRLLSACLELLLPIVLFVLLIAYMITPQIAGILAPSYDASRSLLLQEYLKICYPFFLFSVVTLVWTSMLDANKDFTIARTESAITSITTILACVLLYNIQAVTSLVIAQYVSYSIFAGLLLIRGRRYFKFTFVKFSQVPEIKLVLMTALPLFIGNSVSQINKIVDNSLSTGLGAGNASALSYAVVLEDFVCNILINNVVDVLYVNFSTYSAEGNKEKLGDTMRSAINIMICIMIPITVITCMCAREIVSIAYYRGSFTWNSVLMTSAALIGYALGFLSSGVRDIVLRGLYSFKDTKGPMITGFFAVGFNIFFSILLSRFIGVLGISVASSISMTVNFIINSHMLKKHMPEYKFRKHVPVLVKQVPAVAVLFLVVIGCKHIFSSNVLTFGFSALAGLIVYALVLSLENIPEVDMLKEKVLGKVRK
ncbi:MAG: polysaccharide biosynthesis C-terminal domain-containing protein [Pseudobutyrivibrio sp.]|nr:polysaccharide biosynthesis C-terminal domain-containing protein [Pseudobutyrivibrio sp.]